MFAQQAAIDHIAFHILAAHLYDAQLDQAVRKQNPCAGLDFARQVLKCSRDEARRADYVARRDGDMRPGLESDGCMSLEASRADFGALQILQDADGAVFLLGSAA